MNEITLSSAAGGNLEDAAIALAAIDHGLTDVDGVKRALDALARPVRLPPGATAIEGVARLTLHLFHTEGIRGDEEDYDAPRNSWIDQVLERRRGLPILLSIVTIAVGERAGLALDPIGFPSHFLVAPRDAEERFFVDPFHGGVVIREDVLRGRFTKQTGLSDDAAFEQAVTPVSTRAVLVRMCTNLALAYLRRKDVPGCVRMRAQLEALGEHEGPVVELLRRFT